MTIKRHPLEPLDAAEVQESVLLLKTLPEFTPSTRIISIMLKERSKDCVHSWPGNGHAGRRAEADLFNNQRNQAVVDLLDLVKKAVVDCKSAPPGAQPTMSIDEQVECEQAVLQSPEF